MDLTRRQIFNFAVLFFLDQRHDVFSDAPRRGVSTAS